VIFQVKIFRVVMPCGVVVGCHRFGGPYSRHLQGDKLLYLQVVVFWIVTPCSIVVEYQRFGGPCCLHLQGDKLLHLQVMVFLLVTLRSVTAGYHRVGGPCCLHMQGELPGMGQNLIDICRMDLRNVGILLQHYTASQPGRPRLEPSSCSVYGACEGSLRSVFCGRTGLGVR
jgi:hypothetical protein